MFGGVGAIIGANTGTKTVTQNITQHDFILKTNDFNNPQVSISFKGVSDADRIISEVISTLEILERKFKK